MKHVIALDVGGTGMKAALLAQDGSVLFEARRPTGREHGTDAVVTAILDFAADLADEGRGRFGSDPLAAGVAVPGTLDEKNGIAVFSANLGWRDLPLRKLLGERLAGKDGTAMPVALGHDVRSGGLAEGRLGAGRGVDRFLFIALGTGIAGAIGIGGRIEAGAHGYGGEIGHVVVRPGGPACGCGARGCLETLASASAVSRAWAAASGDPQADAAACADAVDRRDERAVQVWQLAVDALADGIVLAQ
ncbi:ROK family protein, partial [Streptomyces sp. CB03911]|uniref:ROK family protein n=1 Tax=Streptomyces sp. CB03911 TaxID=1804758 RepID=UPI00093AFDEA